MISRLQQAGLWTVREGMDEINISMAWSILARLGLPSRYGGRAQDGSYEYVVVDPFSGEFISKGRGTTLERSMCEAALNAISTIDSDE